MRSFTLDKTIWDEHVLSFFCKFGNQAANNFWEKNLVSNGKKISAESPKSERVSFIKDKYEKRKYTPEIVVRNKKTLDEVFYHEFLSFLSDSDSLNTFTSSNTTTQYVLPVLLMQMLVSGANADYRDANSKQSLLHHLAKTKLILAAELLLRYSADVNATDSYGLTPCDISNLCSNTEMSLFFASRNGKASQSPRSSIPHPNSSQPETHWLQPRKSITRSGENIKIKLGHQIKRTTAKQTPNETSRKSPEENSEEN